LLASARSRKSISIGCRTRTAKRVSQTTARPTTKQDSADDAGQADDEGGHDELKPIQRPHSSRNPAWVRNPAKTKRTAKPSPVGARFVAMPS